MDFTPDKGHYHVGISNISVYKTHLENCLHNRFVGSTPWVSKQAHVDPEIQGSYTEKLKEKDF